MATRLLIQVLLIFLPWSLRRRALVRFLGFSLRANSRIGFSLVLCKHVDMAEGARIGGLNVVKGLDVLRLGVNARIGNLNWISGFESGTQSRHFASQPDRTPRLVLGDETAITNRHLIDCTGGVEIGRFTTVAGFRSQILTHSIDIQVCAQRAAPVKVGDYCFVGTSVLLLPGAVVPDYSVIGAGSLVNKPLSVPFQLYAGCPVRPIRPIDRESKYFTRRTGYVE